MNIECKNCDKIIIKGKIKTVKKTDGGSKRIFDFGTDYKKGFLLKPKGMILKNKSNNPDNWEGLCSECQKEQDK